MKNFSIFISGAFFMFIIALLYAVGVTSSENSGYPGLTLFEEDGKCFNARQIVIFQTLAPDFALSHAKVNPYAIYDESQFTVALLGDENSNFYDDQKINIPKGKCAKRVGTYQYTTTQKVQKTVPVVEIK